MLALPPGCRAAECPLCHGFSTPSWSALCRVAEATEPAVVNFVIPVGWCAPRIGDPARA
jgi:hypothetical protein